MHAEKNREIDFGLTRRIYAGYGAMGLKTYRRERKRTLKMLEWHHARGLPGTYYIYCLVGLRHGFYHQGGWSFQG